VSKEMDLDLIKQNSQVCLAALFYKSLTISFFFFSLTLFHKSSCHSPILASCSYVFVGGENYC
jgi:hypothetical protein